MTSAITASGTTTITGTLSATANTTYRVEFFTSVAAPSGYGEGQTFLTFANVTTNGGSYAASFRSRLQVPVAAADLLN